MIQYCANRCKPQVPFDYAQDGLFDSAALRSGWHIYGKNFRDTTVVTPYVNCLAGCD
jgi:hypothetical protein